MPNQDSRKNELTCPSENTERIVQYFTPDGSIQQLRPGLESTLHRHTSVGGIGLIIVVGLGIGLIDETPVSGQSFPPKGSLPISGNVVQPLAASNCGWLNVCV